MAIEVAIESTIGLPPDVVYAAVADLEAWPTWLVASGIRSVERETDGPLTPGERLLVVQDAAGRAARFDATVATVEPAHVLALRGRDAEGVTIDIEAVVEPAPGSEDVATELRWTIRIGLPLRYRLLESMARPQIERAALLDVEALRLALESHAGD